MLPPPITPPRVPQFMPWAARPERDEAYQIREAHGSDSYIPNTIVTIEVVVTKYEWKYRGLMVDAIDANGTTVGSFDWSRKDSLMWEPPLCPGAAIHINADLKPFVRAHPPTHPHTHHARTYAHAPLPLLYFADVRTQHRK